LRRSIAFHSSFADDGVDEGVKTFARGLIRVRNTRSRTLARDRGRGGGGDAARAHAEASRRGVGA
jgi:hypothetical protein